MEQAKEQAKVERDPNGISAHSPGSKLDADKLDLTLLLSFSKALAAVAEIGTFGAKKYTRDGWASVPDAKQRYTAALMRHLLAEQTEPLDKDSSLHHAAHLAWNALARLELILRHEEVSEIIKSLAKSQPGESAIQNQSPSLLQELGKPKPAQNQSVLDHLK